MPGNAPAGSYCPELVYGVAGDEVDVVVAEAYLGVAYAVPSQLVQLGLFHPLATLFRVGVGKVEQEYV